MNVPVPTLPTGAVLSDLAVGNTVSASHGKTLAQELAYLRAHLVEPVVCCFLKKASGGSATAKVAYNRTPGVQALYIVVEVHESVGDGASYATVEVTVAGSPATWLALTPLDGTTAALVAVEPPAWDQQQYVGVMDVSGLTAGTTTDLHFAWSGSVKQEGIYRISVCEIPLADVNPVTSPTTEPGLSLAWPSAGNALVDGTTSTSLGFLRALDQYSKALTQHRRHLQWVARGEDNSNAWTVTSTTFAAIVTGQNDNPTFRVRACALYGTSVPDTRTFRVRGLATGGITLTVRAIVTPVGGSPTNTDLAIAGSGSWGASTMSIDLPCTGTDQEVDIQFQAKVSSASTARISNISLIE